jgi:phosphatidylglycerol:prolipoprotein diacylglycerol transferase
MSGLPLAQLPVPPKPTPGYWVHEGTYEFLVRFPEGWPIEGIRWYGLAYLAGFVIAFALLQVYWKRGRSPLNPDAQGNLMLYGICGVLIGGRVGYMLFYSFDRFVADPLILFRVWEGGMASHGGFLGVFVALLLYARVHEVSLFRLGDLVASVVPPGLFLGRVANFINGELWGKVTDVSWAVVFTVQDKAGAFLGYTEPRHPSQLYQAVLEGLVPLVYLQVRFWGRGARRRPAGQLAGEFLILYAVARIIGEVFREPDAFLEVRYHFGLLSRGQLLSLFLIAGGVLAIWLARRRGETEAEAAAKQGGSD